MRNNSFSLANLIFRNSKGSGQREHNRLQVSKLFMFMNIYWEQDIGVPLMEYVFYILNRTTGNPLETSFQLI